MGRYHAALLSRMRDRGSLVAVADLVPERAQELAAAHGARAYGDYRALLDSETLDAVLILTPPSVRLEPIQIACEKRIAVFVEKPPALTLADGRQIASLLDAAAIINSVGFMYRWLRVVDRTRELLAGQTIACVQSLFVCGVALDPAQPRWTFIHDHAGGPLLEQAVHSLDTIRYLAGDISAVTAFGGNPILPKNPDFTIEDSHALGLRFVSDAVGVHLHSWVRREAAVQVRLFGVDFDLMLSLIPPGSLSGTLRGQNIHFRPRSDDPYATQLSGFLDAVDQQDQSLIRSPFADAVQTLEVTLKAIKAVDDCSLKEPI